MDSSSRAGAGALLGYALRRLAWMLPTFLGVTLVIFSVVRAAPGDPAMVMAGEGASEQSSPGNLEQAAARFRERHQMNQPLWRQYLHYLGPFSMAPEGHRAFGGSGERPWHGMLALEFGGEMHRPSVSVAAEIGRRLRVTVPLALAALLLGYALAIPLGALAAVRRGTRLDGALSALLFALHSVPMFWAALCLVLLFGAGGLGWLPTVGLHSSGAQELSSVGYALDTLRHALLPVLALGMTQLAYLSRQQRAGLLEVLEKDWMRAALAKGLSRRQALWHHALPNAALPLLTLGAGVLPALVGGSIVVETIFDLPGMGRYAWEGMRSRDYNVVLATTTLSAVLTMLGLLLSDISYALVDPRIRLGSRRG